MFFRYRATTVAVARIQYALPAWSGMCSADDRARLDSLLRRAKRLGYSNDDVPPVADLFNSAEDDFFHRVKTNSNHVLQPYLPEKIDISYHLRTRSHNMSLINKTKFLNGDDFLIRMLYKHSYLLSATRVNLPIYLCSSCPRTCSIGQTNKNTVYIHYTYIDIVLCTFMCMGAL